VGPLVSPENGAVSGYYGRKDIVKVEFNDQGSVSVITVTSTVFEFRRHNRAIDVALLLTPEMTSQSSGFFIMKTILSGKTMHALRAYKHLIRRLSDEHHTRKWTY
jgi:hypothetical protein